jgi:hypothetical protein
MRINNVFPEELHVDLLDDVRKLQITYRRIRPGTGTCSIEHVGGRVKVFKVDRFLIERLLENLEQMGDEETARGR